MSKQKNTPPKGADNAKTFDELYKERLAYDSSVYLKNQTRIMRAIADNGELDLLDYVADQSLGVIDFISDLGAIDELQELFLAKTITDYYEILAAPLRKENVEDEKDN